MSSDTDTVFVTMYHPALGNAQVQAPLLAVPTYTSHGWLLLDPNATPAPAAAPYLTQAAADSRYLRDWVGAEAVTAGAVRVAPSGQVIVRTADGTTRSSYDATEQAAWTAVGGQTAAQLAADPALRAAFAALPKVATTVTASGALAPNQHNPVNATSGAKAMTLPTGQAEGTQISVEKTDASTNTVSVTGNIRGAAGTTISLPWQNEDLLFRADSAGSWWPIAGHKTKATLDAAYRASPARVANLPSPLVLAHRGGSNLWPENTMEAFRGAAALSGVDAIECDCALLADGGIGIMHDATVDRTTTAAGNATDYTMPAWRQLVADPQNYLGGGWTNMGVPTFPEMIAAIGGQKVLVPEAKVQSGTALGPAMIKAIVAAGLQSSVILQCSSLADGAAAQAAGIAAMITQISGTEFTPSQLTANGIGYYGVLTTSVTDPTIAALHAAGIKVIGYTLNRHSEVAAWLTRGGDGYFTDDPIYSKGASTAYAYRTSKVPMLGTWAHGMIANGTVRGVTQSNPGGVGWTDTTAAGTRSLLLGPISPVKGNPAADTYTLEFDWVWTSAADTGRWVGAFICASADYAIGGPGTVTGLNGYRVLVTPAGVLQVAKVTDNVAGGTLGTFATTLSQPGSFTLRIQVTPTQIIVTNVTSGGTLTITDSSFRGGYVSLGASGVTAACTRAEVTA